jgi:hypothetical protein
MVEEVRRIILTKDELLIALDAYRRVKSDFLPAGRMLQCKQAGDGVFVVSVELTYGSTKQMLEFSFKQNDLLDPVVKFCMANNIVLPLDSKKCMTVEGEKFVLLIHMNTLEPERKAR